MATYDHHSDLLRQQAGLISTDSEEILSFKDPSSLGDNLPMIISHTLQQNLLQRLDGNKLETGSDFTIYDAEVISKTKLVLKKPMEKEKNKWRKQNGEKVDGKPNGEKQMAKA